MFLTKPLRIIAHKTGEVKIGSGENAEKHEARLHRCHSECKPERSNGSQLHKTEIPHFASLRLGMTLPVFPHPRSRRGREKRIARPRWVCYDGHSHPEL